MEVRQQVTELSGSSLLPVHIDLKGLCYELRVEVNSRMANSCSGVISHSAL